MNYPLPSAFFGAFLLAFTILAGIGLWLGARYAKLARSIFLALYLATLGFVLAYVIFEWPRSEEAQFVEMGQYYTLSALPETKLKLGEPIRQGRALKIGADYLLDQECQSEPCFRGLIQLLCEQKETNRLYWSLTGVSGELWLRRVREGGLHTVRNIIGWGQTYTDGATGIALEEAYSRYVVTWQSPAGSQSRKSLTFSLVVDLDPVDAPPRFVVEHARPRVVDLPNRRNAGEQYARAIYLTSEPTVALQSAAENVYLPTVTVSSADPRAQVNAYLQIKHLPAGSSPTTATATASTSQPIDAAQLAPNSATGNGAAAAEAEAPVDFIVNNGLLRAGYSYGQRFYLGGEHGILAAVASRGGLQRWQMITAVLLLWLVPLLFYWPLSSYGSLWVFLPLVHMLLAVRFVLGMRAYLWPPYNGESFEGALLAAALIPLLVFIGCFAFGLQRIGEACAQDNWQPRWWRYLSFDFPPLLYYVVTVLVFLLLWVLLRPSASLVVNNALPPRSWIENLLIIVVLPPLAWRIGLLLDRRLRHRPADDPGYPAGADDPMTCMLTGPDQPPQPGNRRPSLKQALPRVLLFGLLFFGVWVAGNSLANPYMQAALTLSAGLCGLLLWQKQLRRLALALDPDQRTYVVALQGLAWVVLFVSALLFIKGLWNLSFRPLGLLPAISAALLPYLPLRTSLCFELLILWLTLRLMAAFFNRWGYVRERFGWKEEGGEMLTLFAAPAVFYFVSLLASKDTGVLLAHWPALVGATLLITGLWPLWKYASGRREAGVALLIAAAVVLIVYGGLQGFKATAIALRLQPHSVLTHRMILQEGTEAAVGEAQTGGPRLIEAIEQTWRMMNYAARGEWTGKGYGNAPVRGSRTFQNITLSDLVFSVYVLAEHGALGGIALLCLYLLFFLATLWIAWHALREAPLRLALAGALAMMIAWPAIYMAAVNVNQLIFTGQDIPLLGLRSRSDILRVGIALLLLTAALRPLNRAPRAHVEARWREMLGYGWELIQNLFSGRSAKTREQAADPRAALAAIALNLTLVGALLLFAALVWPVSGIVGVQGPDVYELTELKKDAQEAIQNGQIWFERLEPGKVPGSGCRGGDNKNRAAIDAPDPSNAYHLCIERTIKGGKDGDTFAELVREWNTGKGRERYRGDWLSNQFDQKQFFRLKLDAIAQDQGQKLSVSQRAEALTVSPGAYRWTSPFRPFRGWTGALTDESVANNEAGVLIGAGLALPLLAAKLSNDPEEFAYVGTNTKLQEKVGLDQPKQHMAKRKFIVYENLTAAAKQVPIFSIETVAGAEGAVLRPEGGDFDLFINGCPLMVGTGKKGCEFPTAASNAPRPGTVPPIRLDYGDVIAYAPRQAGRPALVPRHVFIYGQARIGVFSYQAWINGEMQRVYPQSTLEPLAKQITQAIAAAGPTEEVINSEIAITLSADLSREVDELLQRWRARLNNSHPLTKVCSSRPLSVALMDTETGALLALGSNYGEPYNPQLDQVCPRGDTTTNMNFVSHRIGSVVKPFTAAATLSHFPQLVNLRVLDNRKSDQSVFGLPLEGEEGISGRGGKRNIGWPDFLPASDNLYAVTLSLLGMAARQGNSGLPAFTGSQATSPLELKLTDKDSSLGAPRWEPQVIFNVPKREITLLEMTHLAQGLHDLFDVVSDYPTHSNFRYDSALWSPLLEARLLGLKSLDQMRLVSPEKPNIALADVRNFHELRSVLLGGEFSDLEEYGRVGNAWSNVYLAQSLARIVTGHRVTAQIVAPVSSQAEPWAAGANVAWREELLRGLEGVARQGTAKAALGGVIEKINQQRGGSEPSYFTVFCKTGTLDADGKKGAKRPDSIFIFSAGVWDAANKKFVGRSITGAIYLEQAEGQAQFLAAELIKILNDKYSLWGQPQA